MTRKKLTRHNLDRHLAWELGRGPDRTAGTTGGHQTAADTRLPPQLLTTATRARQKQGAHDSDTGIDTLKSHSTAGSMV